MTTNGQSGWAKAGLFGIFSDNFTDTRESSCNASGTYARLSRDEVVDAIQGGIPSSAIKCSTNIQLWFDQIGFS